MSNPIGKLPKWAQVMIFFVLFFPIIFCVQYVKNSNRDSQEAKKIKAMMKPLETRLDEASEIGGIVGLKDLLDQQIAALSYSSSVMDKKEKGSPFIYCNMAIINLSNG
ncbi:MAG: hypothetical protein LBU45_02255, partial [Azoarcus sp.]|nr:hypothetical protein [Azoarcus sp.]